MTTTTATLFGADLERGTIWSVSVTTDSFTVGCSPRASVPVADRSLAPHELVIARRGEGVAVRALSTQAGFRLNGRSLVLEESVPLSDGDCLRGGNTVLVFYRGEVKGEVAFGAIRREQRRAVQATESRSRPRRVSYLWIATLILGTVLGAGLGALFGRLYVAEDRDHLGKDLDRLASELDLQQDEELLRSLEALSAIDLAGSDDAPAASGSEAGAPRQSTSTDDSPESSLRRLFRLTIDISGRPPTREEVTRWMPLSHAERWQAILASGSGTSGLPELDSAERLAPVFLHFLAAEPEDGKLESLRPLIARYGDDELWKRVGQRLTASERYASFAFRRPRDRSLLGRSLIVDLLDRPPRDDREAELVARAFEEAPLAAARTLIHAKGPRASGIELATEFFRFTGRLPTAAETEQLGGILEATESEEARAALLLALTIQDGYGTY